MEIPEISYILSGKLGNNPIILNKSVLAGEGGAHLLTGHQ